MRDPNWKKSQQLGMPFGTACGRLRKLVLFEVLRRHKENVCIRCGKLIRSAEDLTMDHRKVWIDTDPALFWDMTNIGFAHRACNRTERVRVSRVEVPVGHSRCSVCRKVKALSEFTARAPRWNGVAHECKGCKSKINARRYVRAA